MEHLQEVLQTYSNTYLLEQFIDHQGDYTPEALKLLKKEIDRRKISQEEIDAYLKRKDTVIAAEKKHLDTDDFFPFDHSFSHTDLLLASTVLKDSKVIFYVDNLESTDTLPIESEASKRYTIHVHKDSIEKAHQLIDEHFEKNNGEYSLKYSGAIERLKSFSFHDLHMNEFEAAEKIEVALTNEERRVIIHYGDRLLKEVDQIEESQERVVFYYDAIEELIGYLSSSNNKMLSRSDLLTILEILQVYCQDAEFPSTTIESAISTLLSFFMNQ